MAKSITYGMGQYRFNKSFSYIEKIFDSEISNNNTEILDNEPKKNYFKNNSGGINYKDIYFNLIEKPASNISNSGSATKTQLIQYGTTYYMELKVPQHRKYQLTLNLKLCAENSSESGSPDLNHFQNIKRLIIPPTPSLDDIISQVILYEDPRDNNAYKELIRAAVIDEKHIVENINNSNITLENHDVYYDKASTEYYFINGTSKMQLTKDTYSANKKLTQDWKINNSQLESPATITFKFAFSPKYQQKEGFSFLVIETERSGVESHELEYIEDSITYYGTKLDLSLVQAKIYSVANLLSQASEGASQIQAGITQLNHIAVWGHPEQIITINGEEIKIGQTGFYELKDFNITYLGVVVDKESYTDRFTIDYEYRLVSQET